MTPRLTDIFSRLRGKSVTEAPEGPFSNRADGPAIRRPRGASTRSEPDIVVNYARFARWAEPGLLGHQMAPGANLSRPLPPQCCPGTRVSLLKKTPDWCQNMKRQQGMLWITGPAGCGKSAIAQTFGENCREAGRLGAAIFFSRLPGLDEMSRVMPTLAYQLALQAPSYKELITDLLEGNSEVLESDLSTQFQRLIWEPARTLQSSLSTKPLVIILDGLDGCQDQAAQLELISLIGESLHSHDHASPFLWMICTRPEPHLMKALKMLKRTKNSPCRHVELLPNSPESVEDVARMFQYAFGNIRKRYADTFDLDGWPATAQLARLKSAASGFFLFASAIVEFVGKSGHNPVDRLEICLNSLDSPSLSRKRHPFRPLDALYLQILSGVHKTVLPMTLDILGLFIAAPDNSSARTTQYIRAVLDISPSTFCNALQALHSVFYVPTSDRIDIERPQFYHSSFPEFLKDPSRSGEYAVKRDSRGLTMLRELEVPVSLPAVGFPRNGFMDNVLNYDLAAPQALVRMKPLVDVDTSSQQTPMNGSEAETSITLPDPEKSDGAGQSVQVAMLLSEVIKTSQSRKALFSLQGDRAQLMVNYVHSLLLEPSLPMPWLRKHGLIALRELSKASLLYPHCYFLKDITLGPRETGGTFSDVHQGQHGEQNLCLKVVRLSQKSDTEAMLRIYVKEAILWGQLNHPNVVPFYGIYYLSEERRQVCLVSPWMCNGNLVDHLKFNPAASRPRFAYDVAAGLSYLHDQSLIHSDIKGTNILVNDSGRACITDFGLSSIRTDQTLAYSFAATTTRGFSHHWAAPELLEDGARATFASDVWALGCVFYEILTGTLPFHGSSDIQIVRKLMRGELPVKPTPLPSPGSAEDSIWKLADRCWSLEPPDRPTSTEVSRELEEMGLAKEHEEGVDDMIKERHVFQYAMRKNEETLPDLDRIEDILRGL